MCRAVYRWVDTIGFLRLGELLSLILRAAISRKSTSRSTSPTEAASSKESDGVQPSKNRFSAGHRDGRTRYVARKRIGQHDVCRRKLGWLARSLHRHLFAEVRNRILRHGRRYERLTLNVLPSFAQFERGIAGERIRDKFAPHAARACGWAGPSRSVMTSRTASSS
jgi:hypothetical protein